MNYEELYNDYETKKLISGLMNCIKITYLMYEMTYETRSLYMPQGALRKTVYIPLANPIKMWLYYLQK
jgi:hypothetical protein